jgi:D-3-phosphoglycerate dehydrogenase / 2-oxoglutarate reductase
LIRVAVIDDFHRAFAEHPGMSRLKAVAGVTIHEDAFPTQDAFVHAVGDAEIIIANRERTHFTAALLEQLPKLRLISNTGSHFYHVDIDAATRLGIALANAPGGSSPSVAEMTIGFIVSLVRRIPQTDAAMRRGEWPLELFGSIQSKRLGIIGMGKIGTRVARAANALEMEVVAWGPTLDDARAERSGVRRLELDEVMATSDFVSIHVMLSDLTRRLIDHRRIGLMKPTAFLINTARAAITDEEALADALAERRIAGAALDVFMEEPLPPDARLRKLDNVLLSPHAGWTTHESYGPWIEMTIENAIAFIAGNPIRVHNPEALEVAARAR